MTKLTAAIAAGAAAAAAAKTMDIDIPGIVHRTTLHHFSLPYNYANNLHWKNV